MSAPSRILRFQVQYFFRNSNIKVQGVLIAQLQKWLIDFVTLDFKIYNWYCTKHHRKLRGQKIYSFVLITINNQLLVDPNIGP